MNDLNFVAFCRFAGEDCLSLRTFIDNCSPIRGTREIGGIANVDVDENGNIILDDPLN